MCSRWDSTLTGSGDWRTTAAVLRWWRFPVLMEPFRSIVRARAGLNAPGMDQFGSLPGNGDRPDRGGVLPEPHPHLPVAILTFKGGLQSLLGYAVSMRT